jgi:hypothetical protein
MVKRVSFKRLILRSVSPMVIRLVSVSDQMPLHEFHNVFPLFSGERAINEGAGAHSYSSSPSPIFSGSPAKQLAGSLTFDHNLLDAGVKSLNVPRK